MSSHQGLRSPLGLFCKGPPSLWECLHTVNTASPAEKNVGTFHMGTRESVKEEKTQLCSSRACGSGRGSARGCVEGAWGYATRLLSLLIASQASPMSSEWSPRVIVIGA